MKGQAILIIDDDNDVLNALRVLLEDEFSEVVTENHTHRISTLAKERYEAVLLDMNFSAGINSGNEGLFWLDKILAINPQAVVVVMTAYGNIGLAVEAIKRGARDFVLKPWVNEKLIATLTTAIASAPRTEKDKNPTPAKDELIWGTSSVMAALRQQMQKVAITDASVLLLGENGTGKDMVAREIHAQSPRASHDFIAVDLSALAPTLFESELFGHKKGAFTGAVGDNPGRFETARQGTLFLDEIGNLPMGQQVKLLTVLQQNEITPVGSSKPVATDVRLITATSAPLTQRVADGLFRQDLLYRINTIVLQVPPVRDRGEDVLILAEHFLNVFSTKYRKKTLRLEQDARNALLRYDWPGNVRELRHALEKVVILCQRETIAATDLDLSVSSSATEMKIDQTLDELEKEALHKALRNHSGNMVQTAKALGITRQTLYNKIRKYGI